MVRFQEINITDSESINACKDLKNVKSADQDLMMKEFFKNGV